MEGAICDIMNTIGVFLDTPGLLHHGGDNHRTRMAIVDLRHEIMSTLMYLGTEIDGDKIAVPNHHPFDDLLVDLCPAQERRPQGITEMITQGLDVAATVLADPELLFVVVVEETEGREPITVAVIELDPIHLQIRLAHIHPEDREGDAALQYHPAVLLLQQVQNITSMAVLCYHHHLYQGLALAQLNEIAGGLADREDLRLVVVMKCMLHALMLVKDEATTAVGIGAAVAIAVAIAVNTRSARLRRKLQTEIPVYRGSGKGKGVGPWKDMHLLREDGVTPLQSLHPLRSDTKQLILLKRKRIGHPLNPSAERLKTNRLLSGGTKRWVATSKPRTKYIFCPSLRVHDKRPLGDKAVTDPCSLLIDCPPGQQMSCVRSYYVRRYWRFGKRAPASRSNICMSMDGRQADMFEQSAGGYEVLKLSLKIPNVIKRQCR